MREIAYILVAVFSSLTMLLLPAKIMVLFDGIDSIFPALTKTEVMSFLYFLALLSINVPIYAILSKRIVRFKSEKRMVALSFFLVFILYAAYSVLPVEPFVSDTIQLMLSSKYRLIALSVIFFVLAPIVEEIVVRGVILTSLDAGMSKFFKYHIGLQLKVLFG